MRDIPSPRLWPDPGGQPPRRALAPGPHSHFTETVHDAFWNAEKPTTTVLTGGLTSVQNRFVAAAFRGAGYLSQALPEPDRRAFETGKEFCGRGQCNPTYFMVGSLLNHLATLRDEIGLSTKEIIANNVFLTAGACGPCRFGSYITEYRRALREAGFEGFRVILLAQKQGRGQVCGSGDGLVLDLRLTRDIVAGLIGGDVLNIMGYRLRPYETVAGSTDAALARCTGIIERALERRTSLLRAFRACGAIFSGIATDRAHSRPRAAVIGEFWAMTTEGDGNYRLQRFLESEGAEVIIQPLASWLLYMLWQGKFDTLRRMRLPVADGGRQGLEGRNPYQRLARIWLGDRIVRAMFYGFARLTGLRGFRLPDMDRLARLAGHHYSPELRGGEGHLEVAKLLDAAERHDCDLVISVKPFGCLPSSGVSDGIQARVRALDPATSFLSIETTGDAAELAYSRVQMAVFKAKSQLAARAERNS